MRAAKEIPQKAAKAAVATEIRPMVHRLLFSSTVNRPTAPQGEAPMNPSPSKNSLPTTRGKATIDARWGFDVSFSDAALFEFSRWMDEELLGLEIHFESFITANSQKRSFG